MTDHTPISTFFRPEICLDGAHAFGHWKKKQRIVAERYGGATISVADGVAQRVVYEPIVHVARRPAERDAMPAIVSVEITRAKHCSQEDHSSCWLVAGQAQCCSSAPASVPVVGLYAIIDRPLLLALNTQKSPATDFRAVGLNL
ncbi:hypothetical protein J6524_36275 [Bradyrhizobium sp. WSM 1738]|uniref:hypothetical protein n=1 Tax=Bradyrhizobium hereditatis TaxID=2821405 RepID=UPI001CE2EF79|nr:hypothetical protein [Bradyrhizobium hereditatis]MCA6120242.1 hypothetical protein [Bradyrhizobium hereditatis]